MAPNLVGGARADGCNWPGGDASYFVDCANVKVQPIRLQALDMGEPFERAGRKATGLTPDAPGYGSRAAEGAWVLDKRFGGSLICEGYAQRIT